MEQVSDAHEKEDQLDTHALLDNSPSTNLYAQKNPSRPILKPLPTFPESGGQRSASPVQMDNMESRLAKIENSLAKLTSLVEGIAKSSGSSPGTTKQLNAKQLWARVKFASQIDKTSRASSGIAVRNGGLSL